MAERRTRPGAAALRELSPDDPTRVGPYEIEAKIGEGGMGAVYLGRGPGGQLVAVKMVRPELAGDGAFLSRFHDEMANAERVASFCTAQVIDHGQDLGLAYMVTEYIDGPSLLQHISENGPLSPGMLHGVAVGVAAALVAIHSVGLVHRDLKPSNVLLSISGPRVIDFGIARALDAATSHTKTGQVVGTPGYIAPEQILTQEISPAVDVFAWGCLVAYAANGRNPFGSGSFQIMVGRALHAQPELGALTDPLASLVRAALSKEPQHRPTARGLLLNLVGGSGEAEITTHLGEAWTAPPVPPGSLPPSQVPIAGPPMGETVTDPAMYGRPPATPPPPPWKAPEDQPASPQAWQLPAHQQVPDPGAGQPGTDPRAADQRGPGEQRAADPYGSEQGGTGPRGVGEQHAAGPYAAGQHTSDPYAADPYAADQRAPGQGAADQGAAGQRGGEQGAGDPYGSEQGGTGPRGVGEQHAAGPYAGGQRAPGQGAAGQRGGEQRAGDPYGSEQGGTGPRGVGDQRSADPYAGGQGAPGQRAGDPYGAEQGGGVRGGEQQAWHPEPGYRAADPHGQEQRGADPRAAGAGAAGMYAGNGNPAGVGHPPAGPPPAGAAYPGSGLPYGSPYGGRRADEHRAEAPHGEVRTDPAAEAPTGGAVVAPPAKKSSRPTGLLVGSLIVLAVMGSATAGAFLLSDQSKDKSGHASGSSGPVSSGAAPAAGGFPTEPMLVRIDTKPGWPTKCYADIGLYTPGSGSATTLVDGPNCDSLPERSPDRSKIAWTRKVDDKTEAWVMNADGSDQKMVTDKMAGGRVTWSPDGTRLAYMGKDADGVRQIYVITIGESTPKALTTDSSDKDDPMWSSTDRIAFWSKSDGVESIYTLDPARPKYQIKLTKDGVRAVDPEWSPDGSQIAYSRGAYPSGDIWVMGADGSNPHRLTKSPAHEMDPAWSQNGKWICYVSGTWDKPRIRAIRADGTGDREVSPTNKELGHPNW